MPTWWEHDASAYEREQHTSDELREMAVARRYAEMADERVAEIAAEIQRLHGEAREIVREHGEHLSPNPLPTDAGRRYDEIQMRIRLLREELEAARAIRERAEGERQDVEMGAGAILTGEDDG